MATPPQTVGNGGIVPDFDASGIIRKTKVHYPERRTEFEAIRGPVRYQEGLERLQMSQQFATAGYLGQLACITERPGKTVASAALD